MFFIGLIYQYTRRNRFITFMLDDIIPLITAFFKQYFFKYSTF